jgi:hypothetical protein
LIKIDYVDENVSPFLPIDQAERGSPAGSAVCRVPPDADLGGFS